MQKYKKYVAVFLLHVFCAAVLPSSIIHEIFADHKDPADNHCQYFHKDLGCHVEEQQDHCDIFKTIAPLYDAAKISNGISSFLVIVSPYHAEKIVSYAFRSTPALPARAPPVA